MMQQYRSNSPSVLHDNDSDAMSNVTGPATEIYSPDDVAWILTNAFLVLSMQSGFGLLECGFVSSKSISNIMFKNTVDVVVGGLSFWAFGYALSMGEPSNAFCGYGKFFYNSENLDTMATDYTTYMIHFSFASTATTLVSGAVAERMRMHAYVCFSFIGIIIYALPASWVWGKRGFLASWGYFDVAGASVVHITGGMSSLVAASLLGPRRHRFDADDEEKIPKMSSPVTALSGMFILWWAWLGLSCGTTMGMSGDRWKLAALIATNTVNASIGGGCAGLILSYAFKQRQYDISYLIFGVLGGLVGITTVSSTVLPGESMFIGAVGGAAAIGVGLAVELAKIDDPVNAVGTHLGAGAWAILSVGLFGHTIVKSHSIYYAGILYSGDYRGLLLQSAGAALIAGWACGASLVILYLISRMTPLRLTNEQEEIGSDWIEHGVPPSSVAFLERPSSQSHSSSLHGYERSQSCANSSASATPRHNLGQYFEPSSHNIDFNRLTVPKCSVAPIRPRDSDKFFVPEKPVSVAAGCAVQLSMLSLSSRSSSASPLVPSTTPEQIPTRRSNMRYSSLQNLHVLKKQQSIQSDAAVPYGPLHHQDSSDDHHHRRITFSTEPPRILEIPTTPPPRQVSFVRGTASAYQLSANICASSHDWK